MPRIQLDALTALARNLPNLCKELEKMNKLKALELKLKFHASVQPTPEWADDIDDILES